MYVHFGHQSNIAERSAFRASHAGNGPPWAVWSKFSLLGLIKQWPACARAGTPVAITSLFVCVGSPLRARTPAALLCNRLRTNGNSNPLETERARNDKRRCERAARFILIWPPNRPWNLRRFCPLGATGGRCKSHFLIRIRPWQFCRVRAICLWGISSNSVCQQWVSKNTHSKVVRDAIVVFCVCAFDVMFERRICTVKI